MTLLVLGEKSSLEELCDTDCARELLLARDAADPIEVGRGRADLESAREPASPRAPVATLDEVGQLARPWPSTSKSGQALSAFRRPETHEEVEILRRDQGGYGLPMPGDDRALASFHGSDALCEAILRLRQRQGPVR